MWPSNFNITMTNQVKIMPAQMKKLLDLLSEDGVLKNGRVVYNNTTKLDFWKRIAVHLNSVEGGAHKNAWKWCKVWSDWKNRTQKKANIVLKRKNYYLQEAPVQNMKLSNSELRLLKIIGYPLDGPSDVIQLEMVHKAEDPELIEETSVAEDISSEYLVEDYILQTNKDQTSDKEDGRINMNDDNDYTNEFKEESLDAKLSEECNEETEGVSDTETDRRKIKQTYKKKKRKTSIDAFKIKAQIEFQKEKQAQKTQELRLRAIELKLKGEELRLKEMEMNKVNYLTNLEEEKLKCFREISASLKELLDRTRTGNSRFNNIIT